MIDLAAHGEDLVLDHLGQRRRGGVGLMRFRLRRQDRKRRLEEMRQVGDMGAGAAHHFRVRRFPAGSDHEVTVTIGADARARVDRMARRTFEPAGAFWALQAERALATHLWQHGQLPDGGRLEVADVGRDDLDVAAAWPSD